jgi:Domain of unknown function (DUF4258)
MILPTAKLANSAAGKGIISEGEVITSYPDDTPYPSVLLLGFHQGRSVHVVVARDTSTLLCYMVTVYHPDSKLWSADFKTPRQP